MIDRELAIKILVEFFRDSFSEDPGGVGDWFAQNGDDVDPFFETLNNEWPEKT